MQTGRLFRRDVSSRLLVPEGETVIDEVTKHWVVFVVPALEAIVAVSLWGLALLTNVQVAWAPMLLGAALLVHAAWKYIEARLDLFVVTNMRVFRISGVVNTKVGTMPLIRILDISVVKPLLGRVLGYGHFVFESAAQEQGLKDVRFVPNPGERDKTIQRVVQRSGLRNTVKNPEEDH